MNIKPARSGLVDDAYWYVAQLKPNGLKMAQRNLNRQGFTTFMPTQKITRRDQGRLKDTWRPLFPGYIFIGFDPVDMNWAAINSTYGVTRLVTGLDAAPAAMPREFMRKLRGHCDDSNTLISLDSLKPGDLVKIISGPFSEVIGRIEKMSQADRVLILLNIMGQTTRVEISNRELEKTAS